MDRGRDIIGPFLFPGSSVMTFSATRIQILALSFSIVVHVVAVVLGFVVIKSGARNASQTAPVRTLTVSLQQIESQPQPEVQPVSKPEPAARPEPVTKALQKKKLKAVKPKPLPRQKTEQKPVQKNETRNIQRKKNIASAPVKAEQKTVAAESTAQLQKIDYYSLLQARIEAHKYYPRTARKQGIEGRVEVSFQLLKNGEVKDIKSSGGHRLLNHAAGRAIKEALPLPVPPADLPMPANIHFTMQYDLKP